MAARGTGQRVARRRTQKGISRQPEKPHEPQRGQKGIGTQQAQDGQGISRRRGYRNRHEKPRSAPDQGVSFMNFAKRVGHFHAYHLQGDFLEYMREG